MELSGGSRVARFGRRYMFFLALTALVYYPALRGQMIWDDEFHVTPPGLRGLRGLLAIWIDPAATHQYYPLLHSAFWLEYHLWGGSVFGYHLANVALHAISACLVVSICRKLEVRGAILAGLIFALHPVCVEAVAWISEQKSTLSGAFYLAAALAYFEFDRTRRLGVYFAATALFTMALLSKTVTATLPAALLAILWYRRGRIDPKRDLGPMLPWLACGAAAGLFTAWVERHYIGAQGADYALSLPQRLLLAGRVVFFYAGKLIWPHKLTFIYPHWNIDARSPSQYLWIVGWLGVTATLIAVARRHRGPLTCWLFFTGTLLPVLGFLNVYPFVYSYVADHFQYLASLGLIVPAAWWIAGFRPRSARVTGAALVLTLAAVTWGQTHMYADDEILYSETLRRNPSCWMAHLNLGEELSRDPARTWDAVWHYKQALALRPDYAKAHNNLGSLFLRIPGRNREAIAEFGAALHADPEYAVARYNLGVALAGEPNRADEAIAELRRVTASHPEFSLAHAALGSVLARDPQRVNEGIDELTRALRSDPNLPGAHLSLADALAGLPDKTGASVGEYAAAAKLNPSNAPLHYRFALALARSGDRRQALLEFDNALSIDSRFAQARTARADLLAETESGIEEAVDEYRAALRVDPNLSAAREGLKRALKKQKSAESGYN